MLNLLFILKDQIMDSNRAVTIALAILYQELIMVTILISFTKLESHDIRPEVEPELQPTKKRIA